MNICPKNTLSILEKLERLGFNNSHFQFIHHWGGIPTKDSSLDSHKHYLINSVRNYQTGGNNFNVAVKLEKCLELARQSKGQIDFVEICCQINGLPQKKNTNNKTQVNPNSGLYVVTLNNSQLISANADDKRIAHKALKVNKENCKFGKAVNLEKRKHNYFKTFGQENINFTPIVALSEVDIAEKEILKQLYQYRLTSPSGYLTEWMKGVDADKIIDLVIETLNKLRLSYELL